MSLAGVIHVGSVFMLFAISSTAGGDEEFEGVSTLTVDYSFDTGINPEFSRRGTITVRSIKSNLVHFSQEHPLTAEEKIKLKDLVQDGGDYRIRVPTKMGSSGDSQVQYVTTFVKACSLYESRLTDILTLNVDQSGNVLGVSMTTRSSYCLGLQLPDNQLSNFNTTVEIAQTVMGPVPDTQTYIQKMEQEKAEKAKGQQADNRSFFAKYWMYLVPAFIFLMFVSSAEPQGGQGGGGGR